MRWKEQAFAKSGDDCGLTIAGFYYICLCRQTGDVEGEIHLLNGALCRSLGSVLSAAPFEQLDARGRPVAVSFSPAAFCYPVLHCTALYCTACNEL